MDKKTIEETLKSIAEVHFPKWSYVFETWEDADRKLEKLSYPAIVCILPTGGETKIQNGRVYDTEYLALAFLDKAPRHAEGEENAEVYNRMKVAGWTFIERMNEARVFEPVRTCPYDTICERLATVVTGVMFSLTLKEREGRCV